MKNTEWLGFDLDEMNVSFDKAFLSGINNFSWYLIILILSLPVVCSGGIIYFLTR